MSQKIINFNDDFLLQRHKNSAATPGTVFVGARSRVDGTFASRSEDLGLRSYCWSCVEVLGKLHIPHCFSPPSRTGNLVHRPKAGSIVAGCIGSHLTVKKNMLTHGCTDRFTLVF